MGPNELLFWMSSRQSGSWLQFRDAVEDLGMEENEEESNGQVRLPLQHRLRSNLERLAHVEFESQENENQWQVAPPVLAMAKPSGKLAGVLCGARSIPLMARLREAAGPTACEEIPFPESPDVVRLFADDEQMLARMAETARVLFQPEATLNLLSQLHPIDRVAIGPAADMPFGKDVTVEQFILERKRSRWEELSQAEAKRAGDGLFRCTRWQSPEHYLRINGRTYVTSGQTGKYFVLHRLKRRVLRYDTDTRKLRVPAICRPPMLVDRALVLCGGGCPPQEHYEQAGRGESSLVLSYSDVDVAVAGFVAEMLRQPL